MHRRGVAGQMLKQMRWHHHGSSSPITDKSYTLVLHKIMSCICLKMSESKMSSLVYGLFVSIV